jgi:hypothetical protein
MTEDEFEKIIDTLEDIKNNTSDIYQISEGISSLAITLSYIRKGIEKNNELLQELINITYNRD